MTTITCATRDSGYSRTYSQTLPCIFESTEPARGLVRTALSAWAVGGLAYDAALVITELVANAARHTSSHVVRVCVTRLAEDTVLIAVTDQDTSAVVRRDAGPDDTSGRGLMLVEALTERWGVTTLPSGKCVWARLKDVEGETSS